MSLWDLQFSRKTGRLTRDPSPLTVIIRDLTGGMNTRTYDYQLAPNQGTNLQNLDLGTPGQIKKRPGCVQVGNDVSGMSAGAELTNYEIDGATDQLLLMEGTDLWKSTSEGNFSSLKSNFAAFTEAAILPCKQSGISPDDICIIQTDQSEQFTLQSDGTLTDISGGSNPPPASLVMEWAWNRVWVLKDGELEYSDAYDSDYSDAFDNTSFRVACGEERALIWTRTMGLIIAGVQGIYSLRVMGTTPNAVTDQPEPLVTDKGFVARKAYAEVNDDVFYLSQRGVESLRRNVEDKLQGRESFPLSYSLKAEFDDIYWTQIKKACAIYFDNKFFLALPTGTSSFNNKVWVYYPAFNAWAVITGWNVAAWAKHKINGEERLYYADANDDKVFRAWNGFTDCGTSTTNGTAINYTEEGRAEDMGQPLIKKSGGEVRVKISQTGDYPLEAHASFDGQDYERLGTISLGGDVPTLPVTALPFTLASAGERKKNFPIDKYGSWDTIKIKLVHNDTNTEDIKVLERGVVTYPEPYQGGE